MTKLDHTAIRTFHYEEAQTFFKDVFNMHMWREIGENQDANAGSKKDPVMRSNRNICFC